MEQNSMSLRVIDEEDPSAHFELDNSKGMDSNVTLLHIESADFRSNTTAKKPKIEESEQG